MVETIETWMEQNDDDMDPDDLMEWFMNAETAIRIKVRMKAQTANPRTSPFPRFQLNLHRE